MQIFTFTKISQWAYEFVQVIDIDEKSAISQLGNGSNYGWTLKSVFNAPDGSIPKVVFEEYYPNEAYEG